MANAAHVLTGSARMFAETHDAAPESYRKSTKRWSMALLDQAIVSGTRFLVTIFIGRFCGPAELGHYSFAFTAFVLMGCVQEALVTTPYAVHFYALRRRGRLAYAGSSLVMHVAIAAIASLAFVIAACVAEFGFQQREVSKVAMIIAVTLPLSLLWEFSRRTTLAQLEVGKVLFWDAASAAFQIAGLSCLAFTGQLTAVRGLAVIGVGCLFVGAMWYSHCRFSLAFRRRILWMYVWRNWKLGSWLAVAQFVGALHGMVPSLMLVLLVSSSATGMFTAYLNFALVANPLYLAVVNLLTPKVSRALQSHHNLSEAAGLIRNAALAMSLVLIAYVIALGVFGDRMVGLIYGPSFVGHSDILVILGVCTIFWAVGIVYSAGLVAYRSPHSNLIASVMGTLACIVTIPIIAPISPMHGAALGLFIGSGLAAGLHVVLFYRVHRAMSVDYAATQPAKSRSTTVFEEPQACFH